jgi:hypothetical protein
VKLLWPFGFQFRVHVGFITCGPARCKNWTVVLDLRKRVKKCRVLSPELRVNPNTLNSLIFGLTSRARIDHTQKISLVIVRVLSPFSGSLYRFFYGQSESPESRATVPTYSSECL